MTEQERTITLPLQTEHPLPVSFTCSREGFCLSGGPDSLSLSAGRFDGSLKFFFPDCKNYYYLPDEDTAVHKSIGCYVERGHRNTGHEEKTVIRKKAEAMYCCLPDTRAKILFSGRITGWNGAGASMKTFRNSQTFKSYAHAALQYVRPGKQQAIGWEVDNYFIYRPPHTTVHTVQYTAVLWIFTYFQIELCECWIT